MIVTWEVSIEGQRLKYVFITVISSWEWDKTSIKLGTNHVKLSAEKGSIC